MFKMVSKPIKIVITGCVAVGKSSVVEDLQKQLDKNKERFFVVKEYIDKLEDGKEMLEKFLKGVITPFEFQCYILNYYRDALTFLKENQKTSPTVVIFERTVDDVVEIFGKDLYSKGKLTEDQLNSLMIVAKNTDKVFDLPSYYKLESLFVPLITTNTKEVTNTIFNIIQTSKLLNIHKVVIGLYNEDEVCYQRMLKRARPGEQDGYTLESISKLNKAYKQLYTDLTTYTTPTHEKKFE